MNIAQARALKKGDSVYRYTGMFNGRRTLQKWTVKRVIFTDTQPDKITLELKSSHYTEGHVNEYSLGAWYNHDPRFPPPKGGAKQK